MRNLIEGPRTAPARWATERVFRRMGTYNTLTATFTCPRCGGSTEMYAELFFGYRDQLSLRLGDRYPWRTDSSPQDGGRPEGGNCDGEGYVECPLCRRDFFVVAHVRSDIIEGLEHDPTKPGYIPDP